MPLFDDGSLFDGSDPSTPVPAPPEPPDGYLGRYQVGQSVPLALAVVDGDGQPAAPDAAPLATVTDPDEAVVAAVKMALAGDAMHFALPYFLGIERALGTYTVGYAYSIGGESSALAGSFDVIPGGDVGGAVISLIGYDRPEAQFVVAQLTSGRLVQGKNPRFNG